MNKLVNVILALVISFCAIPAFSCDDTNNCENGRPCVSNCCLNGASKCPAICVNGHCNGGAAREQYLNNPKPLQSDTKQ